MVHTIRDGSRYVYGYKELVCDTQEDFNNLSRNYSVGSLCLILDSGKSYRLNSHNEWKEITTDTSVSPGGSSSDEIQAIPKEAIQRLLEE